MTSTRFRLLCLAAPTAVLVLINVSAECSRAVIEALALIGLSWRLWPDPIFGRYSFCLSPGF